MANLALSAAPFNNDEDTDIIQKKTQMRNSHNKTIKRTSQKISKKVDDLLNAMHNNQTDEEDTLADFNPPPKPLSSGVERTKRETNMSPNDPPHNNSNKLEFDQVAPDENAYDQQYSAHNIAKSAGSISDNNNGYPTNIPYGNHNTYENPVSFDRSDPLQNKINYMIHLLEEQQDEKSNNVTEEVILYCFLGVFMIFIVDSFARAGKYTR